MSALLLAFALAQAAPSYGEPLSLQGFSGHLNVPSAYGHEPGALHLLATDQVEPGFQGQRSMHTYVVSTALLRWAEGSLRVSETTAPDGRLGLSDLSFNAKLRAPLDLVWPGLPVALAVGTQDEGGAAPHFRSRYAVASARAGWLTATAGWGSGPDRMKGAFAGGTLTPFRYGDLVADWDTRDLNLGARARLPVSILGLPFELGAVAKTTARDTGRWAFAGTFTVPLALGKWREAPAEESVAAAGPLTPTLSPQSGERGLGATSQSGERGLGATEPLPRVEDALEELGLSNVRAAREGDLCLVEYENERYGHAEADALGLAMGALAAEDPAGCARFEVLVDRQQLPFAAVGAPMPALRDWYASGGGALAELLALRWKPARPAALEARPPRTASWLHGALSLSPGLTSFVGTEVSVFDARLSLRPGATLQLWPGAQLAARADLPVAETTNLRPGGLFHAYAHGPRLEDALLQQALPLAPGLTALAAAGVYRANARALLGELVYTAGGHAFGAEGALARTGGPLPAPTSVDPSPPLASGLLTWRWSAPWSLQTLVRGGRFYAGDRGFSVDLGRFFGDTQVGVFYARTAVSILGVSLSLPLGPRRDTRPGLVQLRGTGRFTHEVYSVVQERRNDITPGLALPPQSPWGLEATWLDHGRLNRGSLAGALQRARAVTMRWRERSVARLDSDRV